jgi:DNA-binding NarL/FixJ family response regulator
MEALVKLEQASYDIIFLDSRMPDISGVELYKSIIKKYPKLGDKFVFITGDTSDAETRAFLEHQNLSYIAKTFSREVLEEKVNRVLSK